MRPGEGFRRWMRRTDTRAALSITALLLVAIAMQSGILFSYVTMEALEEADHWMAFALRTAEKQVAKAGEIASTVEDLDASLPGGVAALRLLDGGGSVERVWGRWPQTDRLLPAVAGLDGRRLSALGDLRPQRFLLGTAPLADGRRLELALPLAHFSEEVAEIGHGLLLMSLGSGVLALLIAVGATARAFRPLEQATELLRSVDTTRLSQRLPLLGTGDPVDHHAGTLNQILDKIDSSFARLRSYSGDVAHELRTPLNRVGNVADVALLGDEPTEMRSALETVRRTVHELAEIVQSLLLIAEIDDGRYTLERKSFDARRWIARSLDAYGPLFEERGAHLSMSADPVKITGDRALLDRVLVNLLENALRHAERGARVEVRCTGSDDGVTISVDDSGPGIPHEEREHVFERFVRLGGAEKPGRGLGLALSRAIARMHRGNLWLESSALGGARFVWRIPAAE